MSSFRADHTQAVSLLNGPTQDAVATGPPVMYGEERAHVQNRKKQNRSARRSMTSTSSALALLAFLFFLNTLQRSLNDNKQQGPVVMTRTTTIKPIIMPRNDFTKNKQATATVTTVTTTRDNILVTKFENIFNRYLKSKS